MTTATPGTAEGLARTAAADFGEWRRARRPVVLTDALAGHPAWPRWTLDHLRTVAGQRVVPVEYSLRPIFVPRPELNAGRYFRKEMALAALLALVEDPAPLQHHYASTIPVNDWLPELAADLPPLALLPVGRFRYPVLFAGGEGTGSQLHYDATENLLAVFCGGKEVMLAAPAETPKLYRASVFSPLPHFSRVDLAAVERERYPRFGDLAVTRGSVGPGEVLYIPPGWWHHVVNVGPTLGVTFVYDPPRWRSLRWRYLRVRLAQRVLFRRRWPGPVDRAIAYLQRR